MEGLGGQSSHVERRSEAPDLAAPLQSISAALIRSPHQLLGDAIEGALAEWGRALAADRALVATRESGRFVQYHCWERSHTNGRTRSVPSGAVESLLGQVHLEHTLVCGDRKRFVARNRTERGSVFEVNLPVMTGAEAPQGGES
jgi:predicted transcriptional regulator